MLDFLNSDHMDIAFNGHTSADFGAFIQDTVVINKPEEVIDVTEVLGRDGSVTKRSGTYRDIKIELRFCFAVKNNEGFWTSWNAIRQWLNGKGKLSFSDGADIFYLVRFAKVSGAQRIGKCIGTFTADFTCEPFIYYANGEIPLSNPATINNQYAMPSLPIYEITGNGLCTLTVNGKQFKIQTGGQLTAVIDTKRMISYIKSTGVINNAMVSGDYEDIALLTGENQISVTTGFSFKVIPNWRAL